MKLQIETCPPSVWRNRQSKLVRRLPAFRVAGPYGGIANPRHCESPLPRFCEAKRRGRGNLPILSFTFLLFTFLIATFCAQTTFADGSIIGWGDQVVGADLSKNFIKVDAGAAYSLGLKQDGSIVAWGYNYYGQCNIPAPNSGFIAIAAGAAHSLGLKQDGSIVAWEYNSDGQCNIPSPNSGFIAISAGTYHSLALKQDGSIVAWGDNWYGECNVPSPNTNFVAIAAGGARKSWDRGSHSLGLKVDGSIVAWGAGQPGQSGWPHYGQCNVPLPNSGFIAVTAGGTTLLA